MKRAVNYLRGTATLTARGLFPERLLNLCAQEGWPAGRWSGRTATPCV
ncbi:MAG: hypothetical protein ACLUJG_16220 [Lawsonibacter sp.]